MKAPNIIMIPVGHYGTLTNALSSAIERWTQCAKDADDMGNPRLVRQFQAQIDSAWDMMRACEDAI